MKATLLCLLCALSAQAQTKLLDVWFDHITSTSFRAHLITTGEGFGAAQIHYALPPYDCTQPYDPTTNPYYWDGNLYGSGIRDPYNDAYIDSAGKVPDTTYNVCVSINVSGTWVYAPIRQVHTLSAPGGGYRLPDRATRVNTDYPSDLATNTVSVTVAADCTDFYSQFSAAIARQASQNTVLSLPTGRHCNGTVALDQVPTDVRVFNSTNINPEGSMHVVGHGWNTGQALVFGRKDYSADVPNGLTPTTDGRLYYVQRVDADNFYVAADKTPDSPRLRLTPNGSGAFNVVAYPRALHWIIVRTATPDDQFAPPGVSLGSLAWLPKMAYFTNAAVNHCYTCNPIISFRDTNNDVRRQSLLSHLRFIGIVWTVEDDLASYTTSDPPAWNFFLNLQGTMQEIIIDRCVFMTPSLQQRVYTVLNWNGINTAVIHSYFDKTIAYFFPLNTAGVHQ